MGYNWNHVNETQLISKFTQNDDGLIVRGLLEKTIWVWPKMNSDGFMDCLNSIEP